MRLGYSSQLGKGDGKRKSVGKGVHAVHRRMDLRPEILSYQEIGSPCTCIGLTALHGTHFQT